MNGPEPTALALRSGLASHSRGTIADCRLLPTWFSTQAYGAFVVILNVVGSIASNLSTHSCTQGKPLAAALGSAMRSNEALQSSASIGRTGTPRLFCWIIASGRSLNVTDRLSGAIS